MSINIIKLNVERDLVVETTIDDCIKDSLSLHRFEYLADNVLSIDGEIFVNYACDRATVFKFEATLSDRSGEQKIDIKKVYDDFKNNGKLKMMITTQCSILCDNDLDHLQPEGDLDIRKSLKSIGDNDDKVD